ncbi:hypothetical protein F5148DRAFT_1233794, partial [Russula earlei]
VCQLSPICLPMCALWLAHSGPYTSIQPSTIRITGIASHRLYVSCCHPSLVCCHALTCLLSACVSHSLRAPSLSLSIANCLYVSHRCPSPRLMHCHTH